MSADREEVKKLVSQIRQHVDELYRKYRDREVYIAVCKLPDGKIRLYYGVGLRNAIPTDLAEKVDNECVKAGGTVLFDIHTHPGGPAFLSETDVLDMERTKRPSCVYAEGQFTCAYPSEELRNLAKLSRFAEQVLKRAGVRNVTIRDLYLRKLAEKVKDRLDML